MRIEGLHVDGFGLLHDLEVDGIGPGTTVVLGPNESGKSTLHSFLAMTLVGYPRRNDARGRRRFEPVRGGRHGGRVTVLDDHGGRWVVHRSPMVAPPLRVVAPDGTERTGADALVELLGGGVDLDRYEQVHAIDLDALTGLGSLGGDTLQDLLFDAATVGAGRSLRGAHTAALEARDALWTPMATARPLAVALTARDEARAALRLARADAAGFLELRTRRDGAAARVEELAAAREQLLTELAVLDRVLEAWPVRRRLDAARDTLAALPDAALPTGVADEVRAAAAAVTEARADVERLVVAVEALGEPDGLGELDDDPAPVAEEVLALAGRLPAHVEEVERLRRAEGAAREAAAARDAALTDVGEGWTPDRVTAVRTDAAARESLVLAAGAVEDARRDVAAARRRREALVAVVDRRRDAIARRRESYREPPPADQVELAEEAVAVLRVRIPLLEQAALLRAAEADPAVPSTTTREPSLLRLLPRWVGWALLAVAVFLITLAADAADAATGAVGPVVFVVLVLVVVVPLGFVVGRVAARRLDAWRRGQAGPGVVAGDDDLAGEVDAEVRRAAGLLGLPVPPTLGGLERVARRVATARAARDAAERTQVELAELEAELAAEEADARRAGAELEAARTRLDEARSAWTAACQEVGLQPDAEPRVVTVRHDRVAAAARAVVVAEHARERVADHAAVVVRFHDAAVALLARAGEPVGQGADPAPALADLARRLRADADRRTRHAATFGRRAELRDGLERARGRLAAATGRLEDSLDAAGAADVAELERLAHLDDERRAAVTQRDDAAGRLATLLGRGERAEAARSLLAEGDPIAWRSRRDALADRVAALEAERDEQVRTHTRLAARIEELGGDDAVPRAAQALAAAQAEVDRHARSWVVADATARLLAEAVAAFEREQHPRVLVAASELLATATLGAWTSLRQLDRVLVASREDDAEPVPVDHLSRGTQEQVYLCLRLALADDQTRVRGRSLPLLVDDLLGTTDPPRAEAVARVLADVARRQQVWLFTCDPRTAALVTAADPGAAVLELRRGGTVAGWTRAAVLRRRTAVTSGRASDGDGHATG